MKMCGKMKMCGTSTKNAKNSKRRLCILVSTAVFCGELFGALLPTVSGETKAGVRTTGEVPTPQAVEKEQVVVNSHGEPQEDHDHSGAVEGVDEVEDSTSAETPTGAEYLALHPVPRAIAKGRKVSEKMKQHLPRPDRRDWATTTGSGKGSSFFDFLREAREQTRTPAGEDEDMVIKGGTTSPVYNEDGGRKQNTPEPSTLEVRGTRCEGDWSDDWHPCERQGDNRGREYRTWRIKDIGTDYKCEDAFIADGGKLRTGPQDANHEHYRCGTGFHDTAKYKYRGCWNDKGPWQSRAMSVEPNLPDGINVGANGAEMCARHCGGMMNVGDGTYYQGGTNATRGVYGSPAPYAYFAMQAGVWCFCSNDLDKAQRYNSATTCAKCTPGNPAAPQSATDQANNVMCGAAWANSIYETPYPDNRQYCPGGQTFRRIVQWRDCPPDDDEDNENDAHMIVEDARPPSLRPAEPQPTPHPSTPTVQVVKEVDGTTKEKDCLSDFC